MARSLEELREYLVGEWKFDNNFLDTSGNGNHGTPTDIEWKPTARGLKPYSNNGEVSAPFQIQELSEFTIHINHKSPWTHYKSVLTCLDDLNNDGFILTTYNSGSSLRYKIILYKDGVNEQIWFSVPYNDVDITKFRTFDIVFKNGSIKHYLNGQFIGEHTSNFNSITTHNEAVIGFVDSYNTDTRFYSTALTDDEVLALYNSTKNAVGVRPAERSFTHRLQPDVDDNTVFATDMSTRNADGTLMDLSGEGYANLYGAVRDSGYFADAIRFDKDNENYGRIFATDQEITDKLQVELLTIKHSPTASNTGVFDGIYLPQYYGAGIGIDTNNIFHCADGDDNGENIQGIDYTLGVLRHTIIDFDGEKIRIFDDGVKTEKTSSINQIQLPGSYLYLSRRVGTTYVYFDNTLYFLTISLTTESDSQIKSRFNSLATLPLYTFDASKYPTSDGWTTNVPYSSMSITSGEFSFTDNGQLQCDSAGSFTLSNSHPFDADEYIKVKVNGTEYADTGSVTVGNTTVSLTQGSTKISVDMGTDDVIDDINIQFRKEVE